MKRYIQDSDVSVIELIKVIIYKLKISPIIVKVSNSSIYIIKFVFNSREIQIQIQNKINNIITSEYARITFNFIEDTVEYEIAFNFNKDVPKECQNMLVKLNRLI